MSRLSVTHFSSKFVVDPLKMILSCRHIKRFDRKLVEAPPLPPSSDFIAGRPKAALFFHFFWLVSLLLCLLYLFVLYVILAF